jgi:hypothetical protein
VHARSGVVRLHASGLRAVKPRREVDAPGYRTLARRLARELARPDALRDALANNPGALRHAVRLLRWIAENEGDDPQLIEIVKQAREVARSLDRFDRAGKRSHGRAWRTAVLARFREYERRHG